MYLWVIIATFIVAIYSYGLSVRPDMDRIYEETKAETFLTRFKVQHNAVRNFLVMQLKDGKQKSEEKEIPYIPCYHPGEYYTANGKNIQKYTHTGDAVSSVDESCDFGAIKNYLPVGYEPHGGILSKVFCFKDGNHQQTCSDDATAQSCCTDEAYIVSYTQVPSRWYNKVQKHPSTDMMAAMAKSEGYGQVFGYVIKFNDGQKNKTDQQDADYGLSGGKLKTDVPAVDEYGQSTGKTVEKIYYQPLYDPIIKALSEDENIKKICNEDNLGQCLVAIQPIK